MQAVSLTYPIQLFSTQLAGFFLACGAENRRMARQKVTLLILKGKSPQKIFRGFTNYRDQSGDFSHPTAPDDAPKASQKVPSPLQIAHFFRSQNQWSWQARRIYAVICGATTSHKRYELGQRRSNSEALPTRTSIRRLTAPPESFGFLVRRHRTKLP
ncbi:hypothetical protein EN829_031215 [Mesorhizobium sp. M00.F.Ca.ET.186.01.1.1]|nr:hypothetical protein EN848_31145 [bacterium M00.F.Ca.ET.205.01.1.1]TGU46630.1 hypothetical protein EN795_31540 [bacterium M00.F.Ca.ET.152.01.1.1]TGV31723.1 hypothetical protein EN829_031215 [Mesorhizobium sp. M00.F.Ca.ET.186.01.1.1]TGZ38898.1 hypothetical protein EN805_31135 [bacterium M00.F.Ca.ET.162.01.1.1]TIW61761.1 MAG: hypothetical protein E5V48_08075 [Mesorhizobium sp.]